MHRLGLVMLLALVIVPQTCLACPMCQEAVPNSTSTEDEDPARLALAYNRSIYLMVGVPYMLLGAVGFMVYRHLRVRDALSANLLPPARPLSPGEPSLSPLPGDNSCSTPSTGEAS